ncbi:putative isoflavone reductase family protein [Phaeomoniella chlamydospora]|uniref:Putative isoflavone reductase family protein n=1 Tax=Phaeomoniella chlamydospora TaxID=158046 RepID=A0A0G2GIU1_PHACM|nr:putative isoflavone reductase family protein [Phaeomoniella chlamydospora]
MSSLNTLYPFLDAAVVETDVEIYWQIYNASKDPSTRDETFQFFRITMITAIAFASRSRHNPSWIVYDNACYLQAAKCIETVTSEISVESLQALMLLIIYCLFRPRKGDIWKLLDYACRLSIELGYHTEQGPAEIEEEVTVQEKRRSTFWSLYTIERIVGQIFGRPSDLPETIFTTKYPDVAGAIELEGDEVAQRFSAAHHYRLVYLRSEIYKEIYLPSSPPVYPLEWYESRLSPILDWYRRTKTTKPEEQLEGVGTVTCSVAFHSTVIFVFQPIILHLLRKTRDGEQRQFHTPELFPEDGFYSACRLIQVYDKVVRSREDSILGTYPMTFMSAHYCWIAAMTIMAHCLLLLDGRLTPKRLVTDPRLLQETSSISLNNIFDISGSCLTLLMFCAEQWPADVIQSYRDAGVNIFVGDIENEEDVRKSYEGIDTIVSCLGRNMIGAQTGLIQLAAEAGGGGSSRRKWFFPSEFGTDIEYGPASAKEIPHQKKLRVREKMRDVEGLLDYTYMVTGPYGDGDAGLYLSANLGEERTGSFDVRNKKAVLLGDGNFRISLATMKDVGKLTLAALLHPSATRNKAVKVNSFTTTDKEILAEFEKQTGGQPWTVSNTSLDELREIEKEAWASQNHQAPLITLRRIWAEGGTLYEKTDNDLIGAVGTTSSLQEAVADAIEKQLSGPQEMTRKLQ